MFKNFISSEIKKWMRDALMVFMLVYPLLFGLIGRYVIAFAAENSDFSVDLYADIIVVALTLMTPLIFGALIGFSILEDRDDHTLTSVRVSPLSIHQFLSFRMIVSLVLSFAACVFVAPNFRASGSYRSERNTIHKFYRKPQRPYTGRLFRNDSHRIECETGAGFNSCSNESGQFRSSG